MNEHVPKEIRDKWPNYEFLGKPFKLKNGKTYIRAKHKTDWAFKSVHFYCFEEDFAYLSREDIR